MENREMKKCLLDTHTHTVASGHAYNTLNEMIKAASDKGLEILGVTEHAPLMPGTCAEIYFQNLRAIRREKYGVKLLLGAELNIRDTDGNLDLSDRSVSELDMGIASMHPPCYAPSASREENTHAYIEAMKKPYINVIGHPDDERYPVDYLALVQAAKEQHVLLELNNNSLNPRGFRQGAKENDTRMLRYCKEYQVPVVMGSDAHVEEDVANFHFAEQLIQELDFPEELVMNYFPEKFLEYIPFAKFE